MAEPTFSRGTGTAAADDDLPRTLRREREAQARRAREQEFNAEPMTAPPAAGAAPAFEEEMAAFEDEAPDATVTRFDIPFLHLAAFMLKVVIAGIPALLLLLAILWGIGEVLTAVFPDLIKLQVLIRMPPSV